MASFLGDPPIKGSLPGTRKFGERLADAIGNVEQNWLIKPIVILTAVTGVIIFGLEMWNLWRH